MEYILNCSAQRRKLASLAMVILSNLSSLLWYYGLVSCSPVRWEVQKGRLLWLRTGSLTLSLYFCKMSIVFIPSEAVVQEMHYQEETEHIQFFLLIWVLILFLLLLRKCIYCKPRFL